MAYRGSVEGGLITPLIHRYPPAQWALPWEEMLRQAVVTALSSLSIMAFSVMVAASLRTIFDLGSRSVNLNDILPTTHTIDAYNRILNYDAGLGDVGYEMMAITLLTLVFFALGTWLFARRHMRAA